MKALVRASIIGSLTFVAAVALTACTRNAPSGSTSEQVVASVIQPASDSDMPEVVVTASRSGKRVLASDESKTARQL
jgi:hypothetical protein